MLSLLSNQNSLLSSQQLKNRQQKRKLIPKGACELSQMKKYEYIKNFIMNSLFHNYIIPINHTFAPFTIVKKIYTDQKYPIYQLYYRPTKVFLMAAQEQSMNIGCNYIISRQKKPQKNSAFMAKLRGNFSRNQFNIFDNGNNPNKQKKFPRKQFGYIKRQTQTIFNSQQKTTIIVPKARQSLHYIDQINQYEPLQFYCSNNNGNPLVKAVQHGMSTIQKLQLNCYKPQNKTNAPKTYTLQTNLRTKSLQVNKKSQNIYELQIGCPLTIIQGFAFLLSLIQAQII